LRRAICLLENDPASLATVALLVARCALAREESRGAHFRADFPTEDAAFAGHVVLERGREPRIEPWS
jgi:L-aspartate oxidase